MDSDTEAAASQWAVFSRADIETRWARARTQMTDAGLDALLVTNEENFQYFTGSTGTLTLHYSLTRPAVLVFPLEGKPIAVVGAALADSVKMCTYLEDVRGYTDVVSFPYEMVIEAIGNLGLSGGNIGAELGQEQRMGMPVGDYLSITQELGQARFVNGAPVLVRTRMFKTPEEVEYMREAAAVTARARQRLFTEAVTPGMTERDVVRNLRRLILEEGGDRTSFVHLISGFPASHSQHHLDRRLTKGSVLYVDSGAYVRFHTIDYARLATLGPASDEAKRGHAVLLEANEAMMAMLHPGVTCSELHRVGSEIINAAGFEIPPTGRLGHGQGICLTEPPSIAPDDHTALEEGMVISTEPEVAINMLWEDVHVITAGGYDQLTDEPVTLHEIPFD